MPSGWSGHQFHLDRSTFEVGGAQQGLGAESSQGGNESVRNDHQPGVVESGDVVEVVAGQVNTLFRYARAPARVR